MVRADTNLWGGYNAMGASQGSQFLYVQYTLCPLLSISLDHWPLSRVRPRVPRHVPRTRSRALAQRCPWPPMRTLVTLGGQHQGVYGIPQCTQKYGAARCEIIRRALSELVYSECATHNVLQRDPIDLIRSI